MLATMRARTAARGGSDRCARRPRGLATTARHVAVELTPQTIEQIAIRVAALLRREHPRAQMDGPAVLMTVKELARHLKLNPAWVYEHAEELGAIRTGSGPKARIRFDPQAATEALRQHRKPPMTPAKSRPGRTRARPAPSAYPGEAPLLKARDPYARGARGRLFATPRVRGVR